MKDYIFTVIGAPVGTYEYHIKANNLEEAKAFGWSKFSTIFSVREA